MKTKYVSFPMGGWLMTTVLAVSLGSARGDQTKANNNNNLELGSSWVSGTAPGVLDNAIWDSTLTTAADCTNTLGSAVTWGGIVIDGPVVPVVINSSATLTVSNGINLANATVNLNLNINTIDLAQNQNWNVASGRVLTTGSPGTSGSINSPNNGNYTVTKTGTGTWVTGGTGDNGSTGISVSQGSVYLNKASSSGAHAVGGPGLTIRNGALAKITGTGGDQIYDGTTVTLSAGATFDLNGNTETVGNLSGAGGVVDNTAASGHATLTLGAGNGTFGGTLQNSGAGAQLALVKSGTGTFTLNSTNSYTGGTTVNGGALQLATTANALMPYTINTGGTLTVNAVNTSSSLPMSSLTLGSGTPALGFNLGGLSNFSTPLISDQGNLTMNGNVAVNVMNVKQTGTYVLLHYAGSRSGAGSFVAGTVPSGTTITDDTADHEVLATYTSPFAPQVIIPTLDTNELVVAVATPQQYGAVGDGITDDSHAFQAALNAVYNQGGFGGGVVYVPAGNYAFYTNITIPTGVTLHGDWTDWTTGSTGMTGTTFKVYFGAGETTNTPFITLDSSTALRDVNVWYPNQNPNSITPYPFTVGLNQDCMVQNVALVNSYQGIGSTPANGGDKHILSTIVGTPLAMGIYLNQIFDVCHAEDIRFSPDIWAESGVSNAPTAGGAYATWMRSNGEGMKLLRVDGETCINTYISGYNVGIEANAAPDGQPGVTFYTGAVSNCAVALLAQDMPTAFGLMFANFTLDGDMAVYRTNTADDANAMFDHCQIIGRTGPAVSSIGADWGSWMQFEDCTISNALQLAGPGVFNVVDSTLLGSTQGVLSANATREAFTGCSFSPTQNIVNSGAASNVLIDARQSISNAFPIVYWTNVVNDYLSRKPALTNLYNAAVFGATGNGVVDDTAAINTALQAAGTNGGGIVYLPAGMYHLTNTLNVPSGVRLQGAFELRHGTMPGADGVAKGTILQPYGGQGTTNGPVAIALAANSGLEGVTISYETQSSNCIPFPATVQGQGPNVYVIGVCSPNPYIYLDLDSYTCTNHFIDMMDGWAIYRGYSIGNGSSGTVMDCHDNWTYWVVNYDSNSQLPQNVQAPVLEFVDHNLNMYTLGNCTEQLIKDFSIIENTFVHTTDENGKGPNATLIEAYCDASIQAYDLDAAGSNTLVAVDAPMVPFNFNNDADLANATVGVLSTTNFTGTARYFNAVLWGGSHLDFNINGGDVGLQSVHLNNNSALGSVVSGGVFHLVNSSANANGSPVYNVTFGTNAGLPGATSEYIGCFSYNGCSLINLAGTNPIDCWMDYALSSNAVLNPLQPVFYGIYPDGSKLYQDTSLFSFTALAPAGVTANHITVTMDGAALTNVSFSGPATSLNGTYPGVTLNKPHTAVLTMTDNNGVTATTTVNFDTFNPTNYSFEAEDYDYDSGKFFDNPQQGAYAGLSGVDGIDYHNVEPGEGNTAYRPNPSGLETEGCSDRPREALEPGVQDYDVGFNSGGNWGNYTRTYPAGIYNVYMRGANDASQASDSASFSLVTGGQGTSTQTVAKAGTFSVPDTGDWQTYTWVPLKGASGNLAQITNSGAVGTFRVTTDNGDYNANFYLLVPSYTPPTSMAANVAPAGSQGGLNISFATQPGYGYQLEYKTNLLDPTWIPLGAVIPGDGTTHEVMETPSAGNRFYRVQIQ